MALKQMCKQTSDYRVQTLRNALSILPNRRYDVLSYRRTSVPTPVIVSQEIVKTDGRCNEVTNRRHTRSNTSVLGGNTSLLKLP